MNQSARNDFPAVPAAPDTPGVPAPVALQAAPASAETGAATQTVDEMSRDVIARYWPGDADLVGLIKTTLDKLNDKLGTGAIRRILARFKADNTRR